MRRRPEKNDGEQRNRSPADVAGDRRPADHRRKGPCGAADHDVLRRAALEPHRVHKDIKGDRQGQEQQLDSQQGYEHDAYAPPIRQPTAPSSSP